jgi:hypothetical protein
MPCQTAVPRVQKEMPAARIKSDQSKVRKTEGYALYYIRQGGTHNVETNEAA